MKKVLFLVVAVVALLFTSCKKEFTITIQSNNEAWGSTVGSGTYAKGAEVSIGAIANSGYQFVSWQDGDTENPRTITVKTNETYTATFASESGGGEEPISAIFSVSETQKVYFSPGNLQWSAKGIHLVAGGGTAAGTWRFAPNQWDTIGKKNRNISYAYTGWIDLFGWVTSGYDNRYPYMTSTNYADYGKEFYNVVGSNYDWGVYNAIYHPKTSIADTPGTWRTLTKDEWVYLLETRPTLSGIRYAKATVCGVAGLIIVPDSCTSTCYPLTNVNTSGTDFVSNIIGAPDWSKMEAIGCVFLPAAGDRFSNSVSRVGSIGTYWSANYAGADNAVNLYFDSSKLDISHYYSRDNRSCGKSVRLVRNAQ